jgi:hypothetical protein
MSRSLFCHHWLLLKTVVPFSSYVLSSPWLGSCLVDAGCASFRLSLTRGVFRVHAAPGSTRARFGELEDESVWIDPVLVAPLVAVSSDSDQWYQIVFHLGVIMTLITQQQQQWQRDIPNNDETTTHWVNRILHRFCPGDPR